MNEILRARINEVCACKCAGNVLAFSNTIGVHQATVDKQLKGQRKVSIETIYAVLNTFGDISPDWLLLGSGSMLRDKATEHNVYDINYGNRVTGNNNITGNTAPVHYNTETDEESYNELVTLRRENKELKQKLEEVTDRCFVLTDKLTKLI